MTFQLDELYIGRTEVASVAMDFLDEKVDPFTLYGTTFKKFVIEVLDGEKIVSRK